MDMHTVLSKLPGFIVALLALLLSACASSPPFDSGGVDRSLTPAQVATNPQTAAGSSVQWGGVILRTTNLKDRTQIEVLAYPLNSDSRPQSDRSPQGRFIVEQAGYLEPASYAQGRLITAVGTVSGIQAEQVGKADYDHPVIFARQLYLWPVDSGGSRSNTWFGIGVGSGGSWGGGVGIGF